MKYTPVYCLKLFVGLVEINYRKLVIEEANFFVAYGISLKKKKQLIGVFKQIEKNKK